MKKFKTIATEDREYFEERIKNLMNEGYEVKHTNLSMAIDTVQRLTNTKANNLRIVYYAYLEKEE